MYLTVILLPLLNFLIVILFGRFLGNKGSQIFIVINMFINFLLSYFIFYEVSLKGSVCFLKLFSWFNVGLFTLNWGFLFDPITATMLIVVNTVSFLVHIYSIEYMKYDPFLPRFLSYLSLFTFFMLILITADNLIQLFVGWEGVGLASYLLINFWFSILEANKSALKAMVMNRLGDIGIVLAISLIFIEYKSLDFSIIAGLSKLLSGDFYYFCGFYINSLTLISIFIFIGAIGKSAQIGLHTWLPDAMAGPTPVSALIHAATMVTAGVFVLIRLSPIIENAPYALLIITFIGVLTSLFAATIGLFQNDLKKIVAYSTCSQLGYMVFICGLSNYSLSIFHLANHAFFKALLFLTAGSIIHSLNDEQDIRKYGGLIHLLPFSYIMFVIGSLALMGVPFLSGFYSKDLIIEIAFSSYIIQNNFVYWLSIIAAVFTTLYSTRLIFLTFFNKPNGFKSDYINIKDSSFLIGFPLLVLSINSIFFGFISKDFFVGLGTDSWLNSIEIISTKNLLVLESEFLNSSIKNLPFLFSTVAIIAFISLNKIVSKINFSNTKYFLTYRFLYSFFFNKWFIDIIYNKLVINFFIKISYKNVINIDRGFIELLGPLFLVRFINFIINKIIRIQTGFIYNYLFIFILSIFLILFNLWFNIYLFDSSVFFILILLILYLSDNDHNNK
uniref:NADH-ubiquinone oxidoreductase chain 5 n=1 Tax=Paramoeba aparasomata TaxID=2583407 RepID=A0A5P8HBA9_9EUKA|nr:NADH dehydrogenase subunit 5 [Paramoeba aparasomata]